MLAVVAFHAFPRYLGGGFVGVDVFFVISGYLISSIIFKQLARSRFTLLDFYARRTRRILPALCLLLAVCLAFGCVALLPDELDRLGKQAFAAAAFAANFSLWRESGYFAPSAELQPFLHLWSLGIEEQFYLFWPLLLMLAWRRRWNVVWMTVAMTVASFALDLYLVDESPSADYYFPFSRFWELGIGCLLAARESGALRAELPRAAAAHVHGLLAALARQLPLAGIALIAAGALLFDRETPFPGAAALAPTLGAACIIGAPRDARLSRALLGSRVLVYIGLISYPLYLWHWPILSFATILHSGPPAPFVRAACVLISVVLAVLTYHLLEIPVRHRKRLRVSAVLVSTAAVLGAAGLAIHLQAGFPARFSVDLHAIREPRRLDTVCAQSVPGVRRFNYCRRVGKESPSVIFLGDSQAQGVFEGTASALNHQRPMMLLGRGGCPPGLDVPKTSREVYDSTGDRNDCNLAWREFTDFVHATRPRLVVLVGAGARFFNTTRDGRSAHYSQIDQMAFRDGLNTLITNLERSSQVVYLLEIPTFDTPPRCFLRPVRLPGDVCESLIPRAELEAQRIHYRATVREIQSQHPRMIVFDPVPSLCTAEDCSEMSHQGDLLYRDKMHLSAAGGIRLAQDSGLAQFIATAGERGGG